MKRCLALGLALLLAGCASGSVRVSSDGSATTTSTSVSIGTRSSLGLALIGISLVAAEHGWRAEGATRPGPLDPGRRINEQDCREPIQDLSANLRCR